MCFSFKFYNLLRDFPVWICIGVWYFYYFAIFIYIYLLSSYAIFKYNKNIREVNHKKCSFPFKWLKVEVCIRRRHVFGVHVFPSGYVCYLYLSPQSIYEILTSLNYRCPNLHMMTKVKYGYSSWWFSLIVTRGCVYVWYTWYRYATWTSVFLWSFHDLIW